ncbi:large subunit ribosomal protein L7A [Cerasibacillus quisquiliarum]|uniref:Ribosome-associated protein L7Ae-like n=1 Tax=Cerasibacillus quisquiliarum TaxID=227865 RepID=A0A511V246_9BACI|nr:50S ribosomal protein L7ae-like protein [Cerasibacillus quisquiliarum]MBB5147152.1 large subunit ribosomal protein L7A [Cerasibacillus quisquiliarum]GEN31968.1 ribosome-associated protein L7Ae-like [Cerasibacillus quisquiliarum]
MSYEKVTQAKSRLIIGTKQSLKAMKNGDVSEVFIAEDADRKVTQGVIDLAEELSIPCHYVDSKKRLGQACGIEVHAATVSIRKP